MIERIREAIRSSGLKQNFIAEKIQMSEAAFSSCLNGRQRFTAEQFMRLCRVLGKSADELFYGGDGQCQESA